MKVKTLSIGIPVHNEAANIAYLLKSILRQEYTGFVLKKIYVTCDGTTDGTDEIVTNLAKEDQRITLRNDRKHKGKMERLMEMYRINTSDFIAIFDGDVVLANAYVLENMIKNFTNDSIVIVGANNQPLPSQSFVGKLINTWSNVWYVARKSYNKGDNVYNVRGCCMVLKNQFAKTIVFPKGIISDAQYIYLFARFAKLKFIFSEKAVVYYRKPTTIFDYLRQSKRANSEDKKLKKIFGSEVHGLYNIPTKYKIYALLYKLTHDPLYTILSMLFTYLIKFYPYNEATSNGIWKRVNSTKTGISMITF